ncbi:hypothetical protein BH09ACT6_BH09ACT6_11070 [soil metagenome]
MQTVQEAITQAVSRKEWARVTELIGEHWSTLMTQSREVLRTAVNGLPEEIVQNDSRWSAARDYLNFIPAAGEARPVQYHHSPANPGDLLDVLASLTSKSAALRASGRFVDAENAADEAIATLDDVSPEVRDTITHVLAELQLQWAISVFYAGDFDSALRRFEITYDDAFAAANTRIAVEAAGTSALIFALMGDNEQSLRWLARVPEYRDAAATDTVQLARHLTRAILAIARLDPDAAQAEMDAAPAYSATPEHWALRALVDAALATTWGDPLAGLARLRAEKVAHSPTSWGGGLNQRLIASAEGGLLLAAGNPLEALNTASAVRNDQRGVGDEHISVLAMWAELELGEVSRALVLCSAYTPMLQGTVCTSINALVVASAGHWQTGATDTASALFSTAVTLMRQHESWRTLARLQASVRAELLASIHAALPEEIVVALAATNPAPPPSPGPHAVLSPREKVVTGYLVRGFSVRDIADAEHVSANTVKTQVRSLYRKLGVSGRIEAVGVALAQPTLWS